MTDKAPSYEALINLAKQNTGTLGDLAAMRLLDKIREGDMEAIRLAVMHPSIGNTLISDIMIEHANMVHGKSTNMELYVREKRKQRKMIF